MHPVLFHFGRVAIPSFSLLLLGGLLLALVLAERLAAAAGVRSSVVWDAGVWFAAAAFVASRLLLVLSNLRSFLEAPVLLFLQPSLTAAGLLLAVVGTCVALWWQGQPVRRVADAWAAPAMVVWAGLALGQLLAGLDPGLPVRRGGLRTSLAGYPEVPVALWAAIAATGLAVWLGWRVRQPHADGSVAAMGLLAGGVAQFCLSFGRLPYLYEPGSAWTMLDPVQWEAAGVAVAGAALLVARYAATAPRRVVWTQAAGAVRGDH